MPTVDYCSSRQQTLTTCLTGWLLLDFSLIWSPHWIAFVIFTNFVTSAIGIVYYRRFRFDPIHLNQPRFNSDLIIVQSLIQTLKGGREGHRLCSLMFWWNNAPDPRALVLIHTYISANIIQRYLLTHKWHHHPEFFALKLLQISSTRKKSKLIA